MISLDAFDNNNVKYCAANIDQYLNGIAFSKRPLFQEDDI